MERRPFIRSGPVQAETAYRRTNTNASRSEMPTNPIQNTPSPDPNSESQRKSAFIRAARRYAEQQSWMIQQDPQHTRRQYRLAIKELLIAASHLTEQPRKPRSTDKPETTKPTTAHLIDAGQRYGSDPSVDGCERLLAMAIIGTRSKAGMIRTKRAPRPKRDALQLTTRLNNQGRTRRRRHEPLQTGIRSC